MAQTGSAFECETRKNYASICKDPLICINCGIEMKLTFIVDKESAKWELKRLKIQILLLWEME